MSKSVRQRLNESSTVMTLLAGLLLLGSVSFIIWYVQPRRQAAAYAYWYDLNEEKLFVARGDQVPPIPAPSGDRIGAPAGTPAGVRAFVFAHGDGSDPNDRFIGWLKTFTPATQSWMIGYFGYDQPTDHEPIDEPDGKLLRSPDGGPWVPTNSEQGRAILKQFRERCAGRRVTPCVPEASECP